MNIKDTLAKLDTVLGVKAPTIVPMTKAQFEEHVTSELVKAKADAEEEDPKDAEKKKGAEKAKKRLEFLRATAKLLVAKSSWEGGNDGAIPIPVYEEGYEAPTEMPTDITVPTPPAGNTGTAGDGQSFAAAGGAQGYNDAASAGGKASGTTVPASGTGTQSDTTYAAPGGQTSFAKSIAELTAVMKGLTPAPVTPVEKAAPKVTGHVDDPAVWSKDLANPTFLKEGIAKRDGEWGTDPWAASK